MCTYAPACVHTYVPAFTTRSTTWQHGTANCGGPGASKLCVKKEIKIFYSIQNAHDRLQLKGQDSMDRHECARYLSRSRLKQPNVLSIGGAGVCKYGTNPTQSIAPQGTAHVYAQAAKELLRGGKRMAALPSDGRGFYSSGWRKAALGLRQLGR